MAPLSDDVVAQVRFGEFTLDRRRQGLFRGPQRVRLSPNLFHVLAFLVQNRDRAVSKTELLQSVWGGVRDPNVVEQAVARLRRNLGDDKQAPRFIETVAGYGYRFVAEVLAPDTSRTPPLSRSHLYRALWALGAVALVGLMALAAWLALRPGPAVRLAFGPDRLFAFDHDGRVAWEHRFPHPIGQPSAVTLAQPVLFANLDGHQNAEILALVDVGFGGHLTGAANALLCYSSRGRLLWRYQPETSLSFGGRSWPGPWQIVTPPLVSPEQGKGVWLSVSHPTWWPGFLVTLDPVGKPETRFVNSGVMYALAPIRNASGSYVLAGGVNNEYAAGSLAVLRVDQDPATSPQTPGSPFACDGCPPSGPHRYFLFPPSELNTVSDFAYNHLHLIRVYGDQIEVALAEFPNCISIYRFSTDLSPLTVSVSDSYPDVHRRLEREGKIKHSYANCPERTHPKRIRLWEPHSGWRDLLVPWLDPR